MTRSMTAGRRGLGLAAGAAAIALGLTGCGAGHIAETANKKASVYGVSADTSDGKLAVRGLAVAYEGVEGYPAGSSAPLQVALVNETRAPLTVEIGVAAPAAGNDPTVTTARSVQLISGAGAPEATPEATPEASGSASAGAGASPTADGEAAGPNASASADPTDAAGPKTSESATPESSETPSPSTGASESSSATPAAPAGKPARITVPASGAVHFTAESAEKLSLVGLATVLRSGMVVHLTFQVSDSSGASPLLTVVTPVGIPLTAPPREEPVEEHEAE